MTKNQKKPNKASEELSNMIDTIELYYIISYSPTARKMFYKLTEKLGNKIIDSISPETLNAIVDCIVKKNK